MANLEYVSNSERLRRDLSELKRIGRSERGTTRLAFTESENSAHNYVRKQMIATGMKTSTDGVGNLYGRLNRNKGKKIVIGSHLDSVIGGGNYDGALGVVMGVEAARVLKNYKLNNTLEIVAFRSEESARFNTSCVGSKLATGFLSMEKAKHLKDKDGVSIFSAIKKAGFNPNKIKMWKKSDIKLFIEPHIEQGRVLLEAGVKAGIVTGIAAPARYKVSVIGREDHSGTTPMHLRKDALAAFSEMSLAVERLAKEYEKSGSQTVATIGNVKVNQGSINKIAGDVVFLLDIRGVNKGKRDKLEKTIIAELKKTAKKRGIKVLLDETERGVPVELKRENYSVIKDAAKKLKVDVVTLPSGAGQDAQYIAMKGIPTAMLFVQNTGGSHNMNENVKISDVALATDVLIKAIMDADKK